MKQTKFLFLLLLSILLSAIPTLTTTAQGQDSNYKWVGNPLSSIVGNSNVDMSTVYLYNVGTGKYLNIGSIWGTSVSAYEVGMPIKLTKNNDGTYQIQGTLATSDGKFLGFPNPPSAPTEQNKPDWDRIYCDRTSANANINWTITETSNGSKTYNLYCYNGNGAAMGGNRYLIVSNGQTISNRLDLVYPTSTSGYGANAEWKFITQKDMKDAFKAQFASNESPADATFLVADQDMNRSNTRVGEWKVSGFNYSMNESFAFDQGASYTYYVGMGNKWTHNDNYQRQYGRYWIGSIRNLGNDSKANGSLTQAVTVLKKGWYKLSCDGFYSPGYHSNMKASLFANVAGSSSGQSNVSAVLNIFGNDFGYTASELTKVNVAADVPNESPYIKAAKLFETGIYNNSILVYVPADNKVLNIGIKVENSTEDLDWTAFDNFQLKYCGDNDMVLDEGQTSLDYITKQELSPNNAYTLILKRTMTPNLWSSITLPVALTAAQFKTAFGDHAKLARLKGQDENIPTRIDFESVDLSNDCKIVINPSQLYIMKSTRTANVTTGSYEKDLNDHSKVTVAAPYFTINNVVLASMPNETFAETPKSTTTEAGNIQFCGTQINQTTPFVPAKSYVLGAKNGKWHHTSSALPIKGFRCWIATNANSATPAKDLTFAIDGTVEGDVTAIQGLEQDLQQVRRNTAVYNLQGQKVADNAADLSKLPAGIYIVNNKKVLTK
ncbi:adhesin [Prevotella intermedia]|uniref:adhesin n=1 Tax=Prevotella intermedia TaxID=28131 RepID=UPI000C1BDE6D|nr:adhesin [Prevotella intermedia]ATV55779.1 adhesin [Prevotella intermedia]